MSTSLSYDMRVFLRTLILLLIIVTVVINATPFAINFEEKLKNGNFGEILTLLSPKNLIKNQKIVSNAFKDKIGPNNACARDLGLLEDALTRRETWALKMLDASSALPSGIMEGNVIDFGSFDECMNIKGESEGVEIRGHHCMYSINTTDGSYNIFRNPTLSICIPSTCNDTDIVYLFNSTVKTTDKLKNLEIHVQSATCTLVDKEFWDTKFIIAFSIFIVYIGLLLFCTFIDVRLERCDANDHYKNPVLSTLAKFSLRKSVASILDTQIPEGNLPALHGIRFLSVCSVVMGHEYFMHTYAIDVNTLSILKWYQSWKSVHVLMTLYTVDTFFTMSGFLMTYLFLKQMPKVKSFNVPMYYLHRYFRFTPAVITMYIFIRIFGPKFGTGPRWDELYEAFGSCEDRWWPLIFYVQNFLTKENMCLGHLWYLAVDMQLFWISPIILYPLYKKPKLGLVILFVFLLASIAIPGAIVGFNKHSTMTSLFISENGTYQVPSDRFIHVYQMPHNRAGPWLIGIMLGFEVANNNRKLKKFTVFIGWLVAIASFSFCIFSTFLLKSADYEYSVVWETAYSGLSRHIWAVGVCWIIYACLHNYAGPIGTILSWNMFLPLSRISFSIYLVHLLIVAAPTMQQKTPYYFSDFLVCRDFISDLIFSIIVGFVFSLLIESPILVLEKIIFKRKHGKVNKLLKNRRVKTAKDD